MSPPTTITKKYNQKKKENKKNNINMIIMRLNVKDKTLKSTSQTLLCSLVAHYYTQQLSLHKHLVNLLVNFRKNPNKARTFLFLCVLYRQAKISWNILARNKIKKLYKTRTTITSRHSDPIQNLCFSHFELSPLHHNYVSDLRRVDYTYKESATTPHLLLRSQSCY